MPVPARPSAGSGSHPEEANELLAARPDRNLLPTAIEQQLGLLLPGLPQLQASLASVARQRAAAQLAAHERVREAARAKGTSDHRTGAAGGYPRGICPSCRGSPDDAAPRPRLSDHSLRGRPTAVRPSAPGNRSSVKLSGTKPEDYGLPVRRAPERESSRNRGTAYAGTGRSLGPPTAHLPEGEAGTGLTNDKWSLPLLRELGFGLLPTSAGPEVGGRGYAISRFFGPVPVHLVGCGLSLDRRAAGQRGAAAVNPHGLVQEFLNRSPDHLWGIVSNGLRLRILRDNQALSRQSFIEFDLEAMFSGEIYADFVLLWLVAHATRFAPREGSRPETCWLEQWTKEAEEQGTRALE